MKDTKIKMNINRWKVNQHYLNNITWEFPVDIERPKQAELYEIFKLLEDLSLNYNRRMKQYREKMRAETKPTYNLKEEMSSTNNVERIIKLDLIKRIMDL